MRGTFLPRVRGTHRKPPHPIPLPVGARATTGTRSPRQGKSSGRDLRSLAPAGRGGRRPGEGVGSHTGKPLTPSLSPQGRGRRLLRGAPPCGEAEAFEPSPLRG